MTEIMQKMTQAAGKASPFSYGSRGARASGWLAVAGTGLSALLGGWDGPVKALLFFMAFDLFSGFAAACKKGAADSRVMLWGGVGKVMVLALVAAHAHGVTVFREVGELRVKETNRLAAVVEGLARLGVNAWVEGDDLCVEGDPGLVVPDGLALDSLGDHRLAMTWALLGLTGSKPVAVERFESVAVSYPRFLDDVRGLAA